MDRPYWIDRKHAAMAMARDASTSEARLIHYELAGRYSIKAAHSLPFLLPRAAPATEGEREVLRTSDVPPARRGPPRPGRNPPGSANPVRRDGGAG
ncbi:MAG: hypothetical protein ACT4N8_06710 [Sphingosinicella sp.]|uniref:hypothetical protein n=1 Tax=Sphingosinicella sp. TaxID=1917971 RepID=UPI0040377FC7